MQSHCDNLVIAGPAHMKAAEWMHGCFNVSQQGSSEMPSTFTVWTVDGELQTIFAGNFSAFNAISLHKLIFGDRNRTRGCRHVVMALDLMDYKSVRDGAPNFINSLREALTAPASSDHSLKGVLVLGLVPTSNITDAEYTVLDLEELAQPLQDISQKLSISLQAQIIGY